MQFGPDGYLYIAVGDGGADPPRVPVGITGQTLTDLFGSILRIDPRHGTPYAIPATNPFVATAGARPEIVAYGLRNPWRFWIDPKLDTMMIGDVGEGAREEIDELPLVEARCELRLAVQGRHDGAGQGDAAGLLQDGDGHATGRGSTRTARRAARSRAASSSATRGCPSSTAATSGRTSATAGSTRSIRPGRPARSRSSISVAGADELRDRCEQPHLRRNR